MSRSDRYAQPSSAGEDQLVAGRYRLRTPLGRGGAATVWRAEDQVTGQDVVIKEIRLPPSVEPEEREVLCRRAMREARAAGRLNHHPGVVTVHGVVEDAGRPWIVMEYVPSRSLDQVVAEEGPLPPERVAAIGIEMLSALSAAHAAGIVHRDVKPANVLLADDGRVVLADFGLASLEGDPSITLTGMIVGSPAYIAPERARGSRVGPPADLWSLGVTLYWAVEGRLPYDRKRSIAILRAEDVGLPEPTRRAGALRPVLEGLLRPDPLRRLTAPAAVRMLRQVAAGELADSRYAAAAVPRPAVAPRGLEPLRGLTPTTGPGRRPGRAGWTLSRPLVLAGLAAALAVVLLLALAW